MGLIETIIEQREQITTLENEIRRLRAERDAFEQDYMAVAERNGVLHDEYFVFVREVERLRAIETAARAVEWNSNGWCQQCGSHREEGHYASCVLGAALATEPA